MARTRIAKFNIQITASAEQISRVFSNLQRQTATWRTNLASGLTTASFAFNQINQAVGPVVAKFQEMAAALDELAKTAARLELPPEFLQTLEIAGDRLGIELSTIQTGLRDLQERIGDVRRGAASRQLGDALAQIGLGSGNLSDDLATAFLQIQRGLSGIDDQAVRASIAAELFGRAGKELLLLLGDSSALQGAARDLDAIGGAYSAESLARLEEFNDAWADITRTFRVLAERLTIEVAPALSRVATWVNQVIQAYNRVARIPVLRNIFEIPGQGLLGAGARFEPTGSATATLSRIQPRGETDVRRIMTKQLEALRAVQRNTEDTLGIVQTGVN